MTAAPASIAKPALPFRDDTLLGVCEGLGEEFGIHANWLRVVFGALLLVSPLAVIGAYLVIGVAVALVRWLMPGRRVVEGSAVPVIGANDDSVPLAKAA